VETALRKREQDYLDEVTQRVREAAEVPVSAKLLDGPIADALAMDAKDVGADLIVMTTHGRGPMSRFWLGSVADQMVRLAPAPLLLLRPGDVATNLKSDEVLRRILIPLDGSELAEHALEPAIELGKATGAEYRLLRIIKPTTPVDFLGTEGYVGGYAEDLIEKLEKLEEEERAAAEHYLEGVAERLRAQSLTVHTLVVCHAQPALAILDAARAYASDAITMETHGRRGLARMFLGSVADKLLRGASLPVLIHRTPVEAKAEPVHEEPAEAGVPQGSPGCFHGQDDPVYLDM
jgi:nucleotide-binding universal stress UspA family protein